MNLKRKQIHVFLHDPFEGPGMIEGWSAQMDCDLIYTNFYNDNAELPSLEDVRLLVIMGGTMNAEDERLFPWLKIEKEFVGKAIRKGIKILGICLGSQLLADVLGAKVYKNIRPEIGWFPVKFKRDTDTLNVNENEELLTFHWHGYTYDLPERCKLLASSDITPHQGFIFNDQVVALQFHPEINKEVLNGMIENCRNDLETPNEFIQTEKQLTDGMVNCDANKSFLFDILENLSIKI